MQQLTKEELEFFQLNNLETTAERNRADPQRLLRWKEVSDEWQKAHKIYYGKIYQESKYPITMYDACTFAKVRATEISKCVDWIRRY